MSLNVPMPNSRDLYWMMEKPTPDRPPLILKHEKNTSIHID